MWTLSADPLIPDEHSIGLEGQEDSQEERAWVRHCRMRLMQNHEGCSNNMEPAHEIVEVTCSHAHAAISANFLYGFEHFHLHHVGWRLFCQTSSWDEASSAIQEKRDDQTSELPPSLLAQVTRAARVGDQRRGG